MSIKIIKDVAGTVAKVEGIDVQPLPLNSYLCSVTAGNGGITIYNPNAPNEQGQATKIFSNVPYTEFVKSDGSVPTSGIDLKADIDLQLTEAPTPEESRYRGLWNASTNTPDLTSLDPAEDNGDFFFVSQAGTYNSVDYGINDRIQYNGTSWDRIPAAEPWTYVEADNAYSVTVLNNRNFVDYSLTSNKDLTLPTLSTADEGWLCTIVNSSSFRLRVLGSTSGVRQLRQGGSIQLLWNGSGFVVLGYTRSNTILSISDFQNAAVNHSNTVYVDQSSAVNAEDIDGSALFPYTNIQDAVDNATDGDTIDIRGNFVVTSPINLPSNKSLYFESLENKSSIKYASYNTSNGRIFDQPSTGSTSTYSFKNIKFANSGDYAVYIRSAKEVRFVNCDLFNNGWDGTGLSTVLADDGTTLGYDSTQADLQAFYAGSNASNGGAMRIRSTAIVNVVDCKIYNNLRGLRIQDCGVGGYGYISRNQCYNNIESGIYLASGSYDANNGCENFTVYNNASKYNANNGILVVGGINNVVSLNIVEGNWNAGIMGWHVSNTRFRDLDLTNNNRSEFNGIGNTGDAHSSITIGGNTARAGREYIADILSTEIYNTGLGSNTSRIGFQILEDVQEITDDYDKTLINIDNVGFKKQDYAIDCLADLDIVKLTIGDCRYIETSERNVNIVSGFYYELPFSNHHTDVKNLDVSLDATTSRILLKESSTGDLLNPYGINDLQAIAFGTKIRIILKGSSKIQLEVEVANTSINGSMVNSVLNQALLQLNNIFTNTAGFATGGNPVTAFNLSNNDLTITLQDGTSYTVDVTTLGVDENKFVSSGALNGSNLELTMNDGSVVTIDASNMINGSSLPAISNDWFIAYGNNSGDEVIYPTVVAAIKAKQPFYNGDFLEKGQEYVWTHEVGGTYILGLYTGAEETSDESDIMLNNKWSNNFKFYTDSSTNTSKVNETSVGVDVSSRYASGYAITNNTVLALAYDSDNYLKLYDISDGSRVLIGQSNTALVGDSQTIFFGGDNQPNAKFPVMVKRYAEWTLVHDFDNSETSIIDGLEEDSVIKSNISIEPGEKFVINFNFGGRAQRFGIDYTGASSGVTNAHTTIDSSFSYGTAEQIVQQDNKWDWNTNASAYNASGPNWGRGSGVNLGVLSLVYNNDNSLDLYSEDLGEVIATRTIDLDGSPIHFYFGVNESTTPQYIPSISKQTIGAGSQPITNFAPDVSNQTINITEGTSFNAQITLDAGSDIVNQYVEEDAPSWAILNQATGEFTGTAPAYNGSSDAYVINCKAGNSVGGLTPFQVTLNVEEVVYTNTKSLKFRDGVSSYLGGNAALITSMERASNGSGSSDAWSVSLWIKGSTANSGQTIFYFGNNDVVNNGYIELRQTNHNGLKRLRLRYGSNNNYIQLTTPSGSITPSSWQLQEVCHHTTLGLIFILMVLYKQLVIHILTLAGVMR